MYIDYFNAIKTFLNTNLSTVKTVDWFNDQYNRYEDLKAQSFPAAYIEFVDPLKWETNGNKLQSARSRIKVHLVIFDIADAPNKGLNLGKDLFKAMHGLVLVNDDEQLSTELVRVESDLNTTFDQLKIIEMVFETTLYDTSAMPNYTEVTARLGTSHPIEE